MSWTTEQAERVRTLWEQGLTATQIAKDLDCGLSRNAVIGKLHRLGLTRSYSPGNPLLKATPHRAIIKRAKRRKPAAPQAEVRPQAQPHYLDAIDAIDLPPDVSAFACTFEQLEPHNCKWPSGDPGTETFRFCGAKRHGELPYCPRHAALAYQGPRPAMSQAERERRAQTARANLRNKVAA